MKIITMHCMVSLILKPWSSLNPLYKSTIHTGQHMARLCCGWILKSWAFIKSGDWKWVDCERSGRVQVSQSLHRILQNRTKGPGWKQNLFPHPFTPSFTQPACLALGVLLSQLGWGESLSSECHTQRAKKETVTQTRKAAATWRAEMTTSSEAKCTEWGRGRGTQKSRHNSDAWGGRGRGTQSKRCGGSWGGESERPQRVEGAIRVCRHHTAILHAHRVHWERSEADWRGRGKGGEVRNRENRLFRVWKLRWQEKTGLRSVKQGG